MKILISAVVEPTAASAWLVVNLALVLAEIWCLMNLSAWVVPVVVLTAVVCALNIREVLSLAQKLLGRFLHKGKAA